MAFWSSGILTDNQTRKGTMLEFVKTYQGEDRASFDYYVEGSHDIYVTVDKRIISVPCEGIRTESDCNCRSSIEEDSVLLLLCPHYGTHVKVRLR